MTDSVRFGEGWERFVFGGGLCAIADLIGETEGVLERD
jgi:hypothetical protein